VSSFLGINCQSNESNTRLTLTAGFKINQLFERLHFASRGTHQLRASVAPYSDEFTKIKESKGAFTSRQVIVKSHFASIIGVLTYLSICCRPDITTVLNKCAQGTSDPQRHHVVWLERLLMYLVGHPNQGLVYNQDGSPLKRGIVEPLAAKYTELRELRTSPYVCFSDAFSLG